MTYPHTRIITTLFASSALLIPHISHADDAALTCTTISDNAARLACFDRAYAAQFPPQNAISTPAAEPKSVDLVKSYEDSVAQERTTIVFANEMQPNTLAAPTDAYTPLAQLYDL